MFRRPEEEAKLLWEILISTNLLEYCDQTSITSWSEMHMYMHMMTESGVTLTNNAVVTLLLDIKSDHYIVAIPLTYPIFSSRITESITVITPVSVEIYRTIQSSLNDSPAGCWVKLTDSFDDPPVRIRFQIEYSSRVPFSVVKRILAVCKTTIQVGFLTIQFNLFSGDERVQVQAANTENVPFPSKLHINFCWCYH